MFNLSEPIGSLLRNLLKFYTRPYENLSEPFNLRHLLLLESIRDLIEAIKKLSEPSTPRGRPYEKSIRNQLETHSKTRRNQYDPIK